MDANYCAQLTKTTKAVFVTANCSLVSVYKIPGTACPTSSFERHEMTVQACPKIMNNRTIVCILRRSHFHYEVSKAAVPL